MENIISEKTNLYKKITKIRRVPFSPQTGKKLMTEEEFMDLIQRKVFIEEKVDGGTYLLQIPEEPSIQIFAEYLKYKHTVAYDKVPIPDDARFTWYIVFDIYDEKNGKFLNIEEKNLFSNIYGFVLSPVLLYQKLPYEYESAMQVIKKLARNKSNFGDELMEGVVIKNYENNKFGKYINPEFRFEIHWRKKMIQENRMSRGEKIAA